MKSFLAVGLLLATSAFAETPPPPPEVAPTPVPVVAVAGSASLSDSAAQAASASESASDSESKSDSESASHLEGELSNGQGQGQLQGQSTTNINQATNLSIGRGLIIPVDCGAGFDGGGANKSGAAFFGMTWTTKTCYQFKAAVGFSVMGEYATSCEILAYIARDALKARRKEVNCDAIAQGIVVQRVTELKILKDDHGRQGYLIPPDSVSRKEFQETIKRVFETTQKK